MYRKKDVFQCRVLGQTNTIALKTKSIKENKQTRTLVTKCL